MKYKKVRRLEKTDTVIWSSYQRKRIDRSLCISRNSVGQKMPDRYFGPFYVIGNAEEK